MAEQHRDRPLGLFEGFGIELEYMIVDQLSLDVRPIADAVLFQAAGEPANEAELGDISWSNELVLHVLELKTSAPATSLAGLAPRFQDHVAAAGALLQGHGAMLLPSGMHPWMDPARETQLWPHEQNEVYRSYDRIFGAHGHGWSNLQSTHINLPFADDAEFARLHAAVRLVVALIPGLAASSPAVDGGLSGLCDTRLEVYRHNQRRIPSLTAQVVPEPVRSIDEYHSSVLARIYRDIAPHDPAGTLQHEWLNSRGAIARFDRDAIEIRVIDIQECPLADLALATLVTETARALVEERWAPIAALNAIPTEALAALFRAGVEAGSQARVEHRGLLRALGASDQTAWRLRELWADLADRLLDARALGTDGRGRALNLYRRQGTLAERLRQACGKTPERERLRQIYRRLAGCLQRGQLFAAGR